MQQQELVIIGHIRKAESILLLVIIGGAESIKKEKMGKNGKGL
jgi:hypothetical protein